MPLLPEEDLPYLFETICASETQYPHAFALATRVRKLEEEIATGNTEALAVLNYLFCHNPTGSNPAFS